MFTLFAFSNMDVVHIEAVLYFQEATKQNMTLKQRESNCWESGIWSIKSLS